HEPGGGGLDLALPDEQAGAGDGRLGGTGPVAGGGRLGFGGEALGEGGGGLEGHGVPRGKRARDLLIEALGLRVRGVTPSAGDVPAVLRGDLGYPRGEPRREDDRGPLDDARPARGAVERGVLPPEAHAERGGEDEREGDEGEERTHRRLQGRERGQSNERANE